MAPMQLESNMITIWYNIKIEHRMPPLWHKCYHFLLILSVKYVILECQIEINCCTIVLMLYKCDNSN